MSERERERERERESQNQDDPYLTAWTSSAGDTIPLSSSTGNTDCSTLPPTLLEAAESHSLTVVFISVLQRELATLRTVSYTYKISSVHVHLHVIDVMYAP